jgi:hypothetical protein
MLQTWYPPNIGVHKCYVGVSFTQICLMDIYIYKVMGKFEIKWNITNVTTLQECTCKFEAQHKVQALTCEPHPPP